MKAMKKIKTILLILALTISANMFSSSLLKTKYYYVVSGTAYPIYLNRTNSKCYIIRQSVSGKEYYSEINKVVSKVVKRRVYESNRSVNQ